MVCEDITAYRMEHHHQSSSWMHDVSSHLLLSRVWCEHMPSAARLKRPFSLVRCEDVYTRLCNQQRVLKLRCPRPVRRHRRPVPPRSPISSAQREIGLHCGWWRLKSTVEPCVNTPEDARILGRQVRGVSEPQQRKRRLRRGGRDRARPLTSCPPSSARGWSRA